MTRATHNIIDVSDVSLRWDCLCTRCDFKDEELNNNKCPNPLPKTVSITEQEYKSLIEDSDKLGFLEDYGVDNWIGYDEAMKAYRETR